MPNNDFNPEWGYLAPRPGLIKSFRMALVAGVIGTVAGMAVAVALVARPAVDLSVAARTMAQLGESDDLPGNSPNDAPKAAASSASAEMLDVKLPPVAAPQVTARPAASPRDLENFASVESHSAATVQHPAAVAALAEAPAVSDNPVDVPGGLIPAQAPKRVSRVQQPATAAANVAALADAPALRDDASTEMSAKAAPAPAPKAANKRVQVARVRTARADLNPRERDNGGPLDLFPLIGRTILGANPFFNDQVR
jgi:hypothetical protein